MLKYFEKVSPKVLNRNGLYGEKTQKELQDKFDNDKRFTRYHDSNKRGKLAIIAEAFRKQMMDNKIEDLKASNPGMQNYIEERIYSKYDKDGKLVKKMNFEESGRKNRKRKQENQMYLDLGSKFNNVATGATTTFYGDQAAWAQIQKDNADLQNI